MYNLKWRYSKLNSGVRQGISDAAIESFTGNRIGSLTREICQNSLDAKDKETDGPVKIVFKEFSIKKEVFPDIKGLTSSFENALKQTQTLSDQKASNLIKKSLEILKFSKINFLRISDFNTTGLDGINSKTPSSWNNLVSSEGISDKDSSAGGSFGIGKNASFATSNLRTVFYSTLNASGQEATIGVSNLPSYDLDEEGSFTQGTEFLGIDEKNTPIPSLITLDNQFNRTTKGTDIYIAGFIEDNNELSMIKEILNNYLYAIHDDSLVIEINNILINKKTLPELLTKHKEDLEKETIELYDLLTNPNVLIYNEKIIEKDDLEIRFILDKEGSNLVSMIRWPWMKVFNQGRFKRHYSFYGAGLIKGKKLNALLRKSENPQHNQWEPDRVPWEKENIRKTISEINRKMRDILEDLHRIDVPDQLDVFGAGDYIPMDLEGDQQAQEKVYDKVLEVEIKPIKKQIKNDLSTNYEEEGNYIIDLDGNIDVESIQEPSNKENKTDIKNTSTTEKPSGKRVNIEKRSIRIISSNDKSGTVNLIFKSNYNYNSINFRINALDEQGTKINNALVISSANKNGISYDVKNDFIYNVDIKAGINKIVLNTNMKLTVSLGVEIYENK